MIRVNSILSRDRNRSEEKKDPIVGNTLITKQMRLTKNPEQVHVAEKSIEKKRTLMMTLNKDVSQIRLQQVKSHADISPVLVE